MLSVSLTQKVSLFQFDPSWRPQCPCDSDFLAPLFACADSFGVTLGMDPMYISSVTRAAAGGCAGGGSTVDTVPTDGTEVTGIVTDPEGVLFQFHATAGSTYLLDTEVGTLLDTVMVLIDSDQTTSIAENDDDERVSCHNIAAIWVAFFLRCQRYGC